MTAKFSASADGTQIAISVGNQPVAQFPATAGVTFCKNKLFNGEVTRINQRAFAGNYATLNTWAAGNNIAQQELCYGYDMWAKASATDMLQVIEAGNFRPSTVHTLSGTGVTTQQITSPASGNWAITVPQTARNVQVEEGMESTPFEIRPISFELAQCQRYFQNLPNAVVYGGTTPSVANYDGTYFLPAPMRTGPQVSNITFSGITGFAAPTVVGSNSNSIRVRGGALAVSSVPQFLTFACFASAVL